jgi:hypothetical protein
MQIRFTRIDDDLDCECYRFVVTDCPDPMPVVHGVARRMPSGSEWAITASHARLSPFKSYPLTAANLDELGEMIMRILSGDGHDT